jgi:restriction system protein
MHQTPSLDYGALGGSLLRSLWPIIALIVLHLLWQALALLWKRRRLLQSGIAEIDLMTGRQFEEYLEALFNKLGYQVELTRYVGDYGVDLVVRKESEKTAVQAKRYKRQVGVQAIGEVLRAKGNYGCSRAMLVTNSHFTRQAQEEARTHGIVLWDREELVRKLLSVRTAQTTPMTPVETVVSPMLQTSNTVADTTAKTCRICGKVVSDKVWQYCQEHAELFGGHIYCFEHQRQRPAE